MKSAQWRVKRNTTFLSMCRDTLPISHDRCANDTVSVAWASFARIDTRLDSLLRERTPYRRVLVYSVGTHYFAQFPGHRLDHYYNHSNASYTRAWGTQYYQDMQRLLIWLSSWRERNVCVIWKTNNIGWSPEHTDTGHPSQNGGAHHYFNYWNIAMAEAAGLLVFDVEPLTLEDSKHHWNYSRSYHDFYHAYNSSVLASALLSFIKTNCR